MEIEVGAIKSIIVKSQEGLYEEAVKRGSFKGTFEEFLTSLKGEQGAVGENGTAASVQIGSVTVGDTPSVTNSGTLTEAILDFVLPKGAKGDKGETVVVNSDGAIQTSVRVGNVESGETASVVNSGTSTEVVLDFVLPKGEQGPQGVKGERGVAGVAGADAVINPVVNVKVVDAGVQPSGSFAKNDSGEYVLTLYLPAASNTAASNTAASNISEVTTAKVTVEPSASNADYSSLKRVVVFFGDSTNAHIGEAAATAAKGQDYTVINNSQGGSLAAYALMSMNGSPCYLKFNTTEFPAKGTNVYVDATLSFGEGVTPFSMHSTTIVIEQADGSLIEASISGQNTAVKVYPRESKSYPLDAARAYPVKLKNNGSTDGICVIGTAKNDINGANIGNWQTVLERIKTYVQKCVAQVEPQNAKRFILLTNWADSDAAYNKETYPFRYELKDAYNNWLKQTYPNQVVDIEAYLLSAGIWEDCGIVSTEDDLALQRNGQLATSLSSDGGAHVLPIVRTKIAEMVIAKAKELGYL